MTVSYSRIPALSPCALLQAPAQLEASDVSVVVPVRENQAGINRLLRGFLSLPERPREIIIVDNVSTSPVTIPAEVAAVLQVAVVPEPTLGPARARNTGWRAASAPWILFTDSDCVPTSTLFAGLSAAMNGAIAYAGMVHALGADAWSRYYDAQRTLIPPPGRGQRPVYLVTANALVWREALERVHGFDERFPLAGGEDIDLAYRLSRIGMLSYAPKAAMLHDFGDGLGGFMRRFVRYGRGNRLLEAIHGKSHKPRPFWPECRSVFHLAAAAAQFALMRYGYTRQRSER